MDRKHFPHGRHTTAEKSALSVKHLAGRPRALWALLDRYTVSAQYSWFVLVDNLVRVLLTRIAG
jgi:hypothetical protein